MNPKSAVLPHATIVTIFNKQLRAAKRETYLVPSENLIERKTVRCR